MLTDVLFEEHLVTAFAFGTFFVSSITVFMIIVSEMFSKDRSNLMLSYFMACLFVLVWFTVGYGAILFDNSVNPETYFRPMIPMLSTLFTGSLVFVYRSKLCSQTITHLKGVIIELKRNIKDAPMTKND